MSVSPKPQTCQRCVMDTSAGDISFDEHGECNYCAEFLYQQQLAHMGNDVRTEQLQSLVAKIIRSGKRRRYDCIVGVSGGVDSSWVLVKMVEMGLRPLAVHMDNGWNSELAQNNIANLVRSLGVDLHTHVIDWDEYRRLMQAFFDADVVDVELLYDNAMLAVNYEQAAKHHVQYILAGTNRATEGLRMPPTWNWFKLDRRNIETIGRKHGGVRLRSFPAIGVIEYMWYRYWRRISWVSVLDLMDYRKEVALQSLESRFGFKRYPYKHYESVFTRFYQGYLLPEKFGIDKRKVHLSNLVLTGQMTRSEAEAVLLESPYSSPIDLANDRKYFLKKMRWDDADLDEYVARPARAHTEYASEQQLWRRLTSGLPSRLGRTLTRR